MPALALGCQLSGNQAGTVATSSPSAILADLTLLGQSGGVVPLTYTIDVASNVTGVWTSSNTRPTAAEVTGGTAADQIGANFTEMFDGSAGSTPLPSGYDGTAYLWLVPAGGPIVYPVSGSISTSFDTVAPTLSAPTAAETGETTAVWGVTSDEAGGTVFAAARLATDGALSKTEIENGTGDAVATSTDASPTADANNGGSFTGLTENTTYVVDMFHRDSQGNESSRETTSSFTTDAASSWSVSSTTGSPATGTNGSYTYYDWTGDGSITFGTAPASIEYLVGGGGGGGGTHGRGGGGGAGGEVVDSSFTPADLIYDIAVGAGGAGTSTDADGGSGGASAIDIQGGANVATAAGGPGGAGSSTNGLNGWNGSGGHGTPGANSLGGTGTGGNGGGFGGSSPQRAAGGGGGAGGVGGDNGSGGASSTYAGDGGDGVSKNFTGSAIIVSAGGGGGSDTSGEHGFGGSSSTGGDGAATTTGTAGAGTAGTGSGGGGAESAGTSGAGGSGRTILRWLT